MYVIMQARKMRAGSKSRPRNSTPMDRRGEADEQDREGILGGVGIACGFRRRVSGGERTHSNTMTNTRDPQPGEKWQF
jgi:hypothetical protein